MNFFSMAKSVFLSKRGLGIIGLFLIFAFVVGIEFVPIIDPGIYHYRGVWFINTTMLLWLSLSIGYKIILILNLKKINLSLVGSFAFIAFVMFFVALIVLGKEEVPQKITWYYTCSFLVSFFVSLFIDILPILSDTDEYIRCVKSFYNFCASKICRRKTIFN